MMLITAVACGTTAQNNAAPENTANGSAEPETPSNENTAPQSSGTNTAQAEPQPAKEPEKEEPEEEIPELTYIMAPISVVSEPSEYGYTYSRYAIAVNELGFDFWDVEIFDKRTGERCGWDTDYDWSGYPGKICVEERPHYNYKFRDGLYDYWATDRATYVVTLKHKGDVLGPEDVQIRARMEYNGKILDDEYTFEVNAKEEDLKFNECAVVHGFNLLKIQGEAFIPEIDSTSSSGYYDHDNNTKSEGFGYTFIHLSDGDFDPEVIKGFFSAMQWDAEKKEFVPFEAPDGYEISVKAEKDGNDLEVFVGLQAGMDDEIPYELFEEIVPCYDDGETQMIFCW